MPRELGSLLCQTAINGTLYAVCEHVSLSWVFVMREAIGRCTRGTKPFGNWETDTIQH